MEAMYPTINELMSLFHLQNSENESCGSGIGILRGERQYLVTAAHICSNPKHLLVNTNRPGAWSPIRGLKSVWKDSDLAIFRSDQENLIRPDLQPCLGSKGQVWGGIGFLLGFPEIPRYEWNEHRPIPMPTLVAGSWSSGSVGWLGGFVGPGYSGGAVIFKVHRDGDLKWSITGMATIQMRVDGDVIGMTQYIPMDYILETIDALSGK